ncbi:hypothetical protein Vretimale_15361 [Volvox reticuliferus]|uniref:Uncharacterized protein n=1 Tax=Volvox reticuliferus TaxID=1737510 RepID=A0A8J4GRQ3_9CHLO|nr:hypothetical protein Vretifemale_16478 [Volvox reticuliferus]GIM11908.1 hypothetical protein Vretimale_15361 [Volvox reticuliferus]
MMTSSVSSSMQSFRRPSMRMSSWRASVRDLREMSSRPQGASHVVAAAANQQFSTVPLPPAIKPRGVRQAPVAKPILSEQETLWSLQSNLRPLIHTWGKSDLSIETFLLDPIAWLMNLVFRIQSMVVSLFTTLQHNTPAEPPHDSAASGVAASSGSTTALSRKQSLGSTAAANCESTSRRGSSGRYMASSTGKDMSEVTALVGAPPAVIKQRSVAPLAIMAVSTAAALALACYLLFRRWRTMVEIQREQAQRLAVKKEYLARQKQRFQRALVVDSVNIELPPIKDMDVQPGPVRVEKVISHSATQQRDSSPYNHQPSNSAPTLAGESLRQWQQFMAASRAKEVTNVTGSQCGGRNDVGRLADRPYVALDERMLADLSERIRRANELTAAGEAAPPRPVITFEQLYANNQESDDEAMARRAAERKARWQKQQAAGSISANVASHRNKVVTRPPSVPPKPPKKPAPATVTASSAAKFRPKAVSAGNPFAVGLFTGPMDDGSSSSAGPPASPASRNNSVRSNNTIPGELPALSGYAHWCIPLSSHAEAVATPRSEMVASSRAEMVSSPRSEMSTSVCPDVTSISSEVSASPSVVEVLPSSSAVTIGSSRNPFLAPPTATLAPIGPPGPSMVSGHTVDPECQSSSQVNLMQRGSELATQTSDGETAYTMATPIGDEPTSCTATESSTQLFANQIVNATELCNRDPTPSSSSEGDDTSLQQQKDSASSPRRVKRLPAAGQLRTPDTYEPAVLRLMRRPGTAPVALDEVKSGVSLLKIQLEREVA